MANPNHQQAGLSVLYLPERLFIGGRDAVVPRQTPYPAIGLLPYAGARITVPQQMPQTVNPAACVPLYAAPLRVRGQHTTTVASAVNTLPPSERLITLRRSRQLWQTLMAYCDNLPGIRGQAVAGVPLASNYQPDQNEIQFTNDVLSTWSAVLNQAGNGQPPLPDALEQRIAIDGLRAWAEFHLLQPQARTINSESAMQDQVQAQLLDPVNMLLRVSVVNIVYIVGLIYKPNNITYPRRDIQTRSGML
jgi:hypothetical protein